MCLLVCVASNMLSKTKGNIISTDYKIMFPLMKIVIFWDYKVVYYLMLKVSLIKLQMKVEYSLYFLI